MRCVLAVASIPFVGDDLQQKWERLRVQLNEGSRGPITNVVDALSGFIPSYVEPWKEALVNYSLEFSLIATAILVSLIGSKILQSRIHDRARLAWHKDFREKYTEWSKESQKGWRNGILLALSGAVVWLILAFVYSATDLVKLELTILVAVLTGLLVIRTVGQRPVSQSGTTAIPGTFASSVGRFLRNNRFLQGIHKWIFERVVPIIFALLLVVGAGYIANRVLFDIESAAGHFCKGSLASTEMEKEKLGTSTKQFDTENMCWSSGLVLEEGRRYRITLSTPGNWFDRTIRADVAGFPADNRRHMTATPLKRWWSEDWFKPIARIGEIGNDEYVLEPMDGYFDKHVYPQCPEIDRGKDDRDIRAKIRNDIAQKLMECAPTPEQRKTVESEILARRTGELFLYVNDAVLMWPGLTDLFFSNNTGTATVSVERITGSRLSSSPSDSSPSN
jgi:hypothetical protein